MAPCPTRKKSQGPLSSDQETTSVTDHKCHTSFFLCKLTCCSSTHHFSKAHNLTPYFLQPEQNHLPYGDTPRSKNGDSRWHFGLSCVLATIWDFSTRWVYRLCGTPTVTESRENTWNIRVQNFPSRIYKTSIKLIHLKKEKNWRFSVN